MQMAFLLLLLFFSYENALNILVHEFHTNELELLQCRHLELELLLCRLCLGYTLLKFPKPVYDQSIPQQQCGRVACAPHPCQQPYCQTSKFCLWSQGFLCRLLLLAGCFYPTHLNSSCLLISTQNLLTQNSNGFRGNS